MFGCVLIRFWVTALDLKKKIIACMMVCVLDRPHVYQADPVRLVDSFLSFFLSFYNDPAYLIDSRHFGDWTSAWPSWMTGDLIKSSRMWLSIQWLLQLTLEKSLFLLTSRGSWSSGQLAGVILYDVVSPALFVRVLSLSISHSNSQRRENLLVISFWLCVCIYLCVFVVDICMFVFERFVYGCAREGTQYTNV